MGSHLQLAGGSYLRSHVSCSNDIVNIMENISMQMPPVWHWMRRWSQSELVIVLDLDVVLSHIQIQSYHGLTVTGQLPKVSHIMVIQSQGKNTNHHSWSFLDPFNLGPGYKIHANNMHKPFLPTNCVKGNTILWLVNCMLRAVTLGLP